MGAHALYRPLSCWQGLLDSGVGGYLEVRAIIGNWVGKALRAVLGEGR